MPVRRQTMIYTMNEMLQTGQTLMYYIHVCVRIYMEEEEAEKHVAHRSDLLVYRRVRWRKFMGFFKTHPSR